VDTKQGSNRKQKGKDGRGSKVVVEKREASATQNNLAASVISPCKVCGGEGSNARDPSMDNG